MRGPLRLIFLTVLLGATATRVRAVVPHVVINSPYDVCQIGVDPNLPQMGAVTSTPMTTSDGEAGFEGQCGVEDVVYFGAGLSQYFAAHATATNILVGKVGVLRGYGYALAESYPDAYGPPFVQATNILSAYAEGGGGGFFVDIITPPPTTAAPHPGDATELMLTPVLDIDCAHYTNAFMLAEITVSFWAADKYTDSSSDFIDPGFIFSTGRRASGSTCPVSFAPPFVVTGLQVGQPVVMRVSLGVDPFMRLGASEHNFGSYYSEVSALNTATALLTDTDGNPVTAASGHSYVMVASLPDLTIPTTTTTTLPPPTTTTTLPGCGGMCGNGTVDASCGEACDCPPTADPVAAAYGCSGSDVIPGQPACVVCRGCQLLSFCPPSTTTTTTVVTTTLPGTTRTTTTTVVTTTLPGASTTTMTVVTTTTTTAPPLPCPGLSGLARVQCQLAAALGRPLCGNEVVPPAVDHALRAKLNAANAALGSATTATSRKGKKLRKRAVGNLRAAGARAARAVKAKNAGRHVSASCAGTITGLTGQLVQEIVSP